MKLISLSLRNFQSADYTFSPKGGDASVFGQNGAGKTRLASAWSWLLFGKDSLNRADFEILPLGPDGQRIKEITQAEVEATLSDAQHGQIQYVEEGRPEHNITFKRVYMEKYGQRGVQRGKLLGHTTEYYIDGVPRQEKDYRAFINQIIPEAQFRLLTNPLYFNDVLSWQERRKILVEVAGDVTDDAVLASVVGLAALPALLDGRSFEDARTIAESRRKALRKSLDEIPPRIDEAQRSLIEVNPGNYEGRKTTAMVARAAKLEQRTQLLAGGGVADKTKELRQIEAQMIEFKSKATHEWDVEINSAKLKLNSLQGDIVSDNAAVARKRALIEENEKNFSRLVESISSLRDQWKKENAEEWVAPVARTTCPTCGQQLPAEQMKEAMEKARATFNLQKSQVLEKLVAQGVAERQRLDLLKAESEKMAGEIETMLAGVQYREDRVKNEQINIDDLITHRDDYAKDPRYIALKSKVDLISGAITQLQGGASADTSELDAEIHELDKEIGECLANLAAIKMREQGLKRIETLKSEEKKWNAELEGIEKLLTLMQEFSMAKARMLSDKINGMFSITRFKLFEQQVNGGIAECCETLGQSLSTGAWTPWDGGLSNGETIRTGLDIVRWLQQHYGVSCPVWVDNSEAVNDIPEMPCQLIKMFVSKDKGLRVA